MALNFHDPNNHAPPVSAADVWDDAGVPTHQAREPGGVKLPSKRALAACGTATCKCGNPEPLGLRIDVPWAGRKALATAEPVTVKQYGGEVVKLEQTLAEGPFQAAKVIPALELTAREEARESQGDSRDWGQTRHHPLRWLVAAGVGVGGVLVAALATQELFLTQKSKTRTPHYEFVEETKIEELKGFELEGPCEADARSLLAAYAKANTAEEVLPLIRDAARLSHRLKQDWQPWQAPANWQPARDAAWLVSSEGGKGHGRLSGRKPNFGPYRAYFVREGDALRLDWEATEGLSAVAFGVLERGIGAGGAIRTYVSPENFYSLRFPETEFRSYKLLAPDREHIVWGYVKLASPAAAALLKVFEPVVSGEDAPTEAQMTLRLSAPATGAQKNQWLIGELLHIDWVSP